MKRQIVESSIEPNKHDLWLTKEGLKKFGSNGWKSLSGDGNSSKEGRLFLFPQGDKEILYTDSYNYNVQEAFQSDSSAFSEIEHFTGKENIAAKDRTTTVIGSTSTIHLKNYLRAYNNSTMYFNSVDYKCGKLSGPAYSHFLDVSDPDIINNSLRLSLSNDSINSHILLQTTAINGKPTQADIELKSANNTVTIKPNSLVYNDSTIIKYQDILTTSSIQIVTQAEYDALSDSTKNDKIYLIKAEQ